MLSRFTDVMRDIARGGLAGAIAGVVIGGLGGRLVMMLAARLNPEATGRFTENGELIGAFTVQGSLALLFFGGLGAGMAAGLVWVVISPWLPRSNRRRWLLAGPLAVALAGSLLIRSENRDFTVLGNDLPIILMFLALAGFIGIGTSLLDTALDRRLPRSGSGRPGLLGAYVVLTGPGLLFLPTVTGFYLSKATCGCSNPPMFVGWALVSTGVVTLTWWVLRVRAARDEPPRAFVVAGRLGVAAAALLGVAHVVPEIARILGAA